MKIARRSGRSPFPRSSLPCVIARLEPCALLATLILPPPVAALLPVRPRPLPSSVSKHDNWIALLARCYAGLVTGRVLCYG